MSSEPSTIGGDQSVEELRCQFAEVREQQIATAEILAAISSSPTDPRSAFVKIAASAARLCGAYDALIHELVGDYLSLIAHHGPIAAGPFSQGRLSPLMRGRVVGRAVLDGETIHIADLQSEKDQFPEGSEIARRLGHRTIVSVPLMRAGKAIGAISIRRTEVRPFTDRQIDLLKTFADQAVIAIENARLFEAEQARTRELTDALEQQTATAEILRAISNSPGELEPVFDAILESAVRLCDAKFGTLFLYEGDAFRTVATRNTTLAFAEFMQRRGVFLPRSGTPLDQLLRTKQLVQRVDDSADQIPSAAAILGGGRSHLAMPMLKENELVGAITIYHQEVRPFTDKQIELVKSFASQAVIAIENARLLEELQTRQRELEARTQELEIASQHKSQFVANMSHELRTPLAAILGYAELMQEGFYEPQGPKSLDALGRVRSNGKHLLGLINTVLDIAKIESGQFSLNIAEYTIESVVETVRAATEALAQNKKLALKTDVSKSLPIGLGDEQRLTQVLLNLVGNAIKFTDAGEVRITASAQNGHFALSVTDTGPGIPEDERERIFEKFRQVDSSNTRAKGGTGLGLAIAREIVEMHGGRIWVESTLDEGSTFRMHLPVRAAVAVGVG